MSDLLLLSRAQAEGAPHTGTMPSSLFADMERNGSGGGGGGGGGGGETLDDQRALQIALDQLSLLGLDNDETGSIYDNEPRKKSVNMTECVPVPSSEHVAEIVGRQGGCLHARGCGGAGLPSALPGGRLGCDTGHSQGRCSRAVVASAGFPETKKVQQQTLMFPRSVMHQFRDALSAAGLGEKIGKIIKICLFLRLQKLRFARGNGRKMGASVLSFPSPPPQS